MIFPSSMTGNNRAEHVGEHDSDCNDATLAV